MDSVILEISSSVKYSSILWTGLRLVGTQWGSPPLLSSRAACSWTQLLWGVKTIAERSIWGLVSLFMRRDGKKLACIIMKKKGYRKLWWKFWKQASSDTAGKGFGTARQHCKKKGPYTKGHSHQYNQQANLHWEFAFLLFRGFILPHTTQTFCSA